MTILSQTILVKLADIFSSLAGWVVALCVFIINLFIGYETSISAVVICVILDTVWGIAASIKKGSFAVSELGRNGMLAKWCLYASVILGFICIEKIVGIQSQLTVVIISTAICLVEIWSMSGSALIIYPNMPFLRLLRHALRGEIARKLGVEESEVEKELH